MAGMPATVHNSAPHTARGPASYSRTSLPHLTAVHGVVSKIADPTAEGPDCLKVVMTAIAYLNEARVVSLEVPERGTITIEVKGHHLDLFKMAAHTAANCP